MIISRIELNYQNADTNKALMKINEVIDVVNTITGKEAVAVAQPVQKAPAKAAPRKRTVKK